MKFRAILSSALFLATAGCFSSVSIDRRPSIALPVYDAYTSIYCPSNPVVVNYVTVDQGYVVNYRRSGFATEIDSLSAEITTNKTVNFHLGGFHSTYATNTLSIGLDEVFKIAQIIREQNTNDVIMIDRRQLK